MEKKITKMNLRIILLILIPKVFTFQKQEFNDIFDNSPTNISHAFNFFQYLLSIFDKQYVLLLAYNENFNCAQVDLSGKGICIQEYFLNVLKSYMKIDFSNRIEICNVTRQLYESHDVTFKFSINCEYNGLMPIAIYSQNTSIFQFKFGVIENNEEHFTTLLFIIDDLQMCTNQWFCDFGKYFIDITSEEETLIPQNKYTILDFNSSWAAGGTCYSNEIQSLLNCYKSHINYITKRWVLPKSKLEEENLFYIQFYTINPVIFLIGIIIQSLIGLIIYIKCINRPFIYELIIYDA